MDFDVNDKLLRASDVAEIFGVDPKTVTRWAKQGKLPSVRTPGGHHRFFESVIRRIIADQIQESNNATDTG